MTTIGNILPSYILTPNLGHKLPIGSDGILQLPEVFLVMVERFWVEICDGNVDEKLHGFDCDNVTPGGRWQSTTGRTTRQLKFITILNLSSRRPIYIAERK